MKKEIISFELVNTNQVMNLDLFLRAGCKFVFSLNLELLQSFCCCHIRGQGDQIWRFFAYWVIVYFGQFLIWYRSSSNSWATFSTVKFTYPCLNFDKKRDRFWAIFWQTHPVTQSVADMLLCKPAHRRHDFPDYYRTSAGTRTCSRLKKVKRLPISFHCQWLTYFFGPAADQSRYST
jgi:hypothetical protein